MPPENIHILHLIATNFVGGPEKQILHHALRASSSGRQIWVASFRERARRPELLERAERMRLPAIELSSGRFDPRTIIELARVIREKKISVLCTHGYKANLLGWAASRLTRCPQIAFARGWTGENWRIRLYERLDRLVLRWTDWVVCVSRPLTLEIKKMRSKRTSPLLVPNCALFPFQNLQLPLDRLPMRKSLGLPQKAFCLCSVGRLSPEKGHRYLLQATANLVEHVPGLLVFLLGEGQERANLEKQAEELGIKHHVIFAGFQNDIRPWIQACDLLVNPSLTEGMPNVVLEAMSLGTPVVATNVGGVPDLIEHLSSGVLVEPADPAALTAAIHSLFVDRTEQLRLAQNAQKRLTDYSPDTQTQRLNELYARVLGVTQDSSVATAFALPIRG